MVKFIRTKSRRSKRAAAIYLGFELSTGVLALFLGSRFSSPRFSVLLLLLCAALVASTAVARRKRRVVDDGESGHLGCPVFSEAQLSVEHHR